MSLHLEPITPPSSVQALCKPLQVGDLTLRNRNVMASLTRNRSHAPPTVPGVANLGYYTQRAEGGVALILTEATLVSRQGTEWPYAPGIWNEEQVSSWKKITDGVHAAGSLIFCQLWHVGRVAHPDMQEQKKAGKPVPGASAISARGGKFRLLPGQPGYVTPTPIDDPRTIVEEFRHAAKMAKRAGFDGVELHSANGYVIQQFLDYNANQRTDQWGGSVENRTRLGLEVIKALVDVWGPARVGIKVNPGGGYNDVGMPLPDTIHTYTHYITELAKMKLAYMQLVRYMPAYDMVYGTTGHKRGTPHDILAVYGSLVKPANAKNHLEADIRGSAMPTPEYDALNPTPTRLFVNGGLTPEEASSLIENGIVDAAVFGMPWICNPDLQARIEQNVEITPYPDLTTLYGPPAGMDIGVGYTDYPVAT